MRTQQEIIDRFNSVSDLLGTQKSDLIYFMTFDNAKQYLTEDFVSKIESNDEVWDMKTDAKQEILDYLSFAYEKAENKRGLSTSRSMLHLKTWIWLDDEEFYNNIIFDIENYTDYGINALDKISKHYKFK